MNEMTYLYPTSWNANETLSSNLDLIGVLFSFNFLALNCGKWVKKINVINCSDCGVSLKIIL